MRDEIEAAVAWWVERLRNAHNERQDNGDFLQSMMATLARDSIPLASEEQLAEFAASLQGRLMEVCLETCNVLDPIWGSSARTLFADYGPSGILAKAAEEAGIETGLFPCKTVMWVNPDKVEVRCGYRAPTVCIYPR